MSYFTNPLVNLIDTPMFRNAIQSDLDRGYRLFEVNAANADGLHVWFQILAPKHYSEYLDELQAMSTEFYFDKYKSHADATLAMVVDEIDIDECNTANLYRMD